MEADCTPLEAQYRRVADAAHARDAHAYLAVGTHFCPTYVYFFDLMVEFAMSWSDYQSYVVPTWMPSASPETLLPLHQRRAGQRRGRGDLSRDRQRSGLGLRDRSIPAQSVGAIAGLFRRRAAGDPHAGAVTVGRDAISVGDHVCACQP